ncbi:21312_t:CDS:1, partial [Dentiscutata erythropus]
DGNKNKDGWNIDNYKDSLNESSSSNLNQLFELNENYEEDIYYNDEIADYTNIWD